MIRWILLAAVALWMFAASPARAGPSCANTTVSNVNFGTPNLLAGGSVDTTATLSISCSSVSSGTFTYCLSLDRGSGGTSGSDRAMVGPGGALLRYNLYQDAARSIPWGSRANPALGSIPSLTFAGGSAPTATYTIYARITSGQNAAAPGSYSSSFSGAQVQFYRLASGQTNCTTGNIETNTPTTTPAFTVSAAPVASCNVSAGSLNFGSRVGLTQNIDATGSISLTCTNSTPYTVGLGNGQTGSSASARKMTNGSNTITYALYTDSNRSNLWSITNTAGGTGSGVLQTVNVYGRVPVQATPAVGSYTDSVVVTVTY